MKLEIAKLKAACDTLIAEYKNRTVHEPEAFEAYVNHKKAEWLEKNQAEWKKVHRLIGQKLRANDVITREDLGFLGQAFQSPTKGRMFEWEGVTYNSEREGRWYDAIRELRVFLDACATDTVTLAELKQTRYPQDFIGDILARAQGIELGEAQRELTY